MNTAFENSSTGQLTPDSILECGVCWWVYDPAVGDEEKDIEAGLAFAKLPADFRCPCCDAPKTKFMLREGGQSGDLAGAIATDTAGDQNANSVDIDARVADLVKAFEEAENQMIGLPVYNDKLHVEAVGFHQHREGILGVIITPWCMNIVVLAQSEQDAPRGPIGANLMIAFPSGTYPFIVGRMDGAGSLDQCSLFSPMDMFEEQDAARLAAEAALDGLLEAPESPQGTGKTTDADQSERGEAEEPSRRAFLMGGRRSAISKQDKVTEKEFKA